MNNSIYNRELLSGAYYFDILYYYFREWNDFSVEHSHNRVEIMYVLKGRCTVEVCGKLVQMKNGDFIFIDANVEHRLLVDKADSCRMLNIEFGFTGESSFLPTFSETCSNSKVLMDFIALSKSYVVLKDNDEIYTILKSIINEIGNSNEDKSTMINIMMLQLILQLSRLALRSEEKTIESSDVYVQKAVQFIQHNYDYDIRIKDIACSINIHHIYLHRIFKEKTGMTILQYMTDFRIEKAKTLLAHTDIPIIDISNYVGINSRQYFSYIFKRKTGVTPNEYRRSCMVKCEDIL